MKYVLPGMGTSSKMYSGPWRELEECTFADWLPYNNETTIAELADGFISEFSINRNDIVIGSSLGGMVGLEIMKKTGLQKVYLIGSMMSPDELNVFLRKIIFPYVNVPIVRLSQWFSLVFKNELRKIYSRFSPESIVNMSKAILMWGGYSGDSSKVARIHGRKDPFINCPADCEVIEDGGHVIALTHARECVEFVKRR